MSGMSASPSILQPTPRSKANSRLIFTALLFKGALQEREEANQEVGKQEASKQLASCLSAGLQCLPQNVNFAAAIPSIICLGCNVAIDILIRFACIDSVVY